MLKKIAIPAAIAMALATPAAANELSPVFGKAKAVSLSQNDAKAVVGKGIDLDLLRLLRQPL